MYTGAYKRHLYASTHTQPLASFEFLHRIYRIKMDFSEARLLVSPLGSVRIFRLAQEASWRCILSETSVDLLRDVRSGLGNSTRFYASDSFLKTFCDEAKLITRPPEDDLFLIPFESLTNSDPSMIDNSLVIWTNDDDVNPISPPARTVHLGLQHIINPDDLLETISLDFTARLRLPNGDLAPESVRYWWG